MMMHHRETKGEGDVEGNTLEENRELLTAKRKNERIKAYKFLVKNLSEELNRDFLANSCETLFEAILNSSKKGDSEEKTMAMTLAAILFMSIEEDRVEEFWEATNGLFHEILNSSSEDLKSATAAALSVSCVLSDSTSPEHVEKLSGTVFSALQKSLEQLDNKDHLPLVLLIKSWSFLISLLNFRVVEEKFFADQVPFFVSLLEDKNVEVRLAAAQTLMMLFEIMKNGSQEDDAAFDLDDYQNVFDVDELLALLQKNTKVEVSLRRKFERIVGSIENNLEDGFSQDLFAANSQIVVKDWLQFAQLEFFVQLVGKGLGSHYARGKVLKGFFGGGEQKQGKEFKNNKKSQKSREQHRMKMRDLKNQQEYN